MKRKFVGLWWRSCGSKNPLCVISPQAATTTQQKRKEIEEKLQLTRSVSSKLSKHASPVGRVQFCIWYFRTRRLVYIVWHNNTKHYVMLYKCKCKLSVEICWSKSINIPFFKLFWLRLQLLVKVTKCFVHIWHRSKKIRRNLIFQISFGHLFICENTSNGNQISAYSF